MLMHKFGCLVSIWRANTGATVPRGPEPASSVRRVSGPGTPTLAPGTCDIKITSPVSGQPEVVFVLDFESCLAESQPFSAATIAGTTSNKSP